jgi:acyl-CoA dehydrogenase
VYIPTDKNAPLAQLDDALIKNTEAEPALGKLRQAMRAGKLQKGDPEDYIEAGQTAGIITEHEAAGIHAAIAARTEVIQVDDFEPGYLVREH